MKKCVFLTGLLICLLVSLAAPTVFAAEEDDAVPVMEFRFGDYGSNGDYLADVTQALMNSYMANTINWRFEAASDTYQFRIAGKHPDVTTTGKNLFPPVLYSCWARRASCLLCDCEHQKPVSLRWI